MDSRDIRKHLNDVLRLSRLLAPATRIPIVAKIAEDMTRFLIALEMETSVDPKSLLLGNVGLADIAGRIAQDYQLDGPVKVRE